MKPLIKSLFIGLILFVSLRANAQTKNDLNKMSPAKEIKQGDNLYKEGSYYNAIQYYESVYDKDNTNAYAINQIAQCEFLVRDYKEGEKWFKTLVDSKSPDYPLALYYYGTMLKYNAKYDLAKQAFQNFIKTYLGDNAVQYKKLANAQIQGCDLAVQMIANPLKVRITHLGTTVNGPYTEFSPMPIGDSLLLFASLKSDTVIVANANNKFTQYAQFYISQKKDTVYSQNVPYTAGPFNSDDSHTGNGSFSPDGKRFYFTRCNPDASLKMICDIYSSEYKDGKWADPQKLPEQVNAPGSSNTQPTIGETKEGEVIYFVSDRANGFGGKDIWFVTRDKSSGTYEQARNLGKKVNTGGDEVTPYYDNDSKILYYSSNGEVGMGGFDIFRSKGEGSKFDNPENLGYPINSADDDMYFVLDKNKRGGYLVSNRPGTISVKSETCCDDIWRFDYIRKIYYVVVGNVYDQDNKTQVLPGASIALLMDNAEIASGVSRSDSNFHFNLAPGKTFVIKASKDGYFAGSSADINVVKKEDNDTMHVNVYMKKIPQNVGIRVANIYYDFNKATLRPESKTGVDSLFQIMTDNPSLILEIGSHTDSKGTHEYNIKLSQARAQSVVDYLLAKGIPQSRLVAKGYAETEPIAPNTIKGKDNPEGRQLNRRTEFKIIGSIPNTVIEYKQGNPNFNPNEKSSPDATPKFFQINKDSSDSTQAH